MYDLIKNILDAVLNLVPKAMVARQEAKQTKLGVSLFKIYLDVYDIVWRSDRILQILRKVSAGYPGAISTTEFGDLLHEQSAALTDLHVQIYRYLSSLAFIAPEETGNLQSMMHGKGLRITTLLRLAKTLDDNSIPRNTAPTEYSFNGLSVAREPLVDDDSVVNEVIASFNSKGGEFDRLLALLLMNPKLEQAFHFEPATDERIARIAVEASEAYLGEFDPQAQLQAIKDVLRRLREGLDKYFTPSDILIALSQERHGKFPMRRIGY